MHYTYILYSASRDRYYIGSSADVSARLAVHNSNHKGFTGKTGDWKVAYTEAFDLKSEALIREKKMKSWKSTRMIEKLINSVGS